jgi:hippurate hydrolase
MELMESGMKRIAKGVAEGFGATAEVDFRVIFAPLINDLGQTAAFADAAAALVGEGKVDRAKPPGMGSEDFSFMMEKVPGAYIQVGNGDSAQLHNPAYNFNDEATPYGAAVLATIVERKLGRNGA